MASTVHRRAQRFFFDNRISEDYISNDHIFDDHISDKRIKSTFFPTRIKYTLFPTWTYIQKVHFFWPLPPQAGVQGGMQPRTPTPMGDPGHPGPLTRNVVPEPLPELGPGTPTRNRKSESRTGPPTDRLCHDTDSDYRSEMIFFGLILTTYKMCIVFWGSWGMIKQPNHHWGT